MAASDSLPWRIVGEGAANESSSSNVGPVMTSCSSLASQLRALPALGALRLPLPLLGALLAGVRLVVCTLMPLVGSGSVMPLDGCDC